MIGVFFGTAVLFFIWQVNIGQTEGIGLVARAFAAGGFMFSLLMSLDLIRTHND